MNLVKKLWKLVDIHYKKFILVIFSTAIATAFSSITPMIIKYTIDSVIGTDKTTLSIFLNEKLNNNIGTHLFLCGFSIVAITIVEGIFNFIKGKYSAITAEEIAKRIKNKLYNSLQRFPYDYHIKAQTGDLIQRCTSDVDTIRRFFSAQVVEMSRIIFILIFTIYFMSRLNIKLMLISLISIPIVVFFSFIFFGKTTEIFTKVDEKEGELSTTLQENISGVRVVRAFGREKFESEKFEEKNSEFRDLVLKMTNLLGIFWAVSDLICLLQTAGVLFAGLYLTSKGEITLGTFWAFNAYLGMLLWPVRNLGRILSEFSRTEVALKRINEILNTKKEEDITGKETPSLLGDIEFNNICFSYEKTNSVLENMSFKIKKGETIAILGATGSGKSTVMHLLLRLYDYDKGSIKINNVELKNIKKDYLREKIAIVLQEPFLYSKTIKENLEMAKDEVTFEDIIVSTKIAMVHNVIESFDKGYDTVVGEKGVTLSGGQKQRVAIARTLLKDSEILIFDDSLSAVDTETDKHIRVALKETNAERTTFIISQRITTLMDADRIFVVEDGRIKDSGTHEELSVKEGLYKRIWEIQDMIADDYLKEAEVN